MKRRLRYRAEQLLARRALHLLFGCEVSGLAHVPRDGACLIASNHKSYLDPPLIGSHLPREIRYFAKKELFRIPILGPVIRDCGSIPVDRVGFDRAAVAQAVRVLRNQEALLLFPEGTRIRRPGLARPKIGVALLALESGAPVIPAYISGSWSPRRSLLRRVPIRLIFGPAMRFEAPEGRAERRSRYPEIAAEVMDAIRKIAAAHGDRFPPASGDAVRGEDPTTAGGGERP